MTGQGFQTAVNVQPGVGVAGDFASINPRFTFDAGPSGLVAGPSGLTTGLFCWTSSTYFDADSTPLQVNNFGSGPVAGFVGRSQSGLITTYLANAGLTTPAGFPVSPYVGGDFWVVNNGATPAIFGQTCYAAFATGRASFAAAGTPLTSTATTFSITAQTFSVTATVVGNVMTVTNVGSGTLYPGAVVSNAGLVTGTTIVSQLTGTTGGLGTYALSINEYALASTTVTGTYGLLTLGGTVTGTFPLGSLLSGTGVPATATIAANSSNGAALTGAGGAGTYVTLTATASTGTITGTTNVATKWFAMSGGLVGELVKISSQNIG